MVVFRAPGALAARPCQGRPGTASERRGLVFKAHPRFYHSTLGLRVIKKKKKREQVETFEGLLPESQGQNQALTVLYVPHSLDSGLLFSLITGVHSDFSRQVFLLNAALCVGES